MMLFSGLLDENEVNNLCIRTVWVVANVEANVAEVFRVPSIQLIRLHSAGSELLPDAHYMPR